MSLEILATAISVLTFGGGSLAWYSAYVQKRYAAQRDFEHLRRNYEQISQLLKVMNEELEESFEAVGDRFNTLGDRFNAIDRNTDSIQQKLNVLMIKILPEHSTGWMKQTDGDQR